MLMTKENPHGGDIWNHGCALDFSANINPYGMPKSVKDAIAEAVEDGECVFYPDPHCKNLREKIAEWEGVSADCILCGNGAAELIYSFAYSLPKDCRPLIIAPTFGEYECALKAAGFSAEYHPLRKKDKFQLTEDILDEIHDGMGALFLCSPNNPTGIRVEERLLWQMAEKCQQINVRLFCDFSFMDLADKPFADDAALLAEYPNVFILKAFTKSYGMAGIRLGYALSSDLTFLEIVSEKAPCWNVSIPAQRAGIAAITEEKFVEECREKLQSERERMRKEIIDLGITVYPGTANFLLLESQLPLSELLFKRGIQTRKCGNYPFLSDHYVRIAVRTPEENAVFLEELKRVVQEESDRK